MKHRTHDKGDLGLAEVILDLAKNGFKVCLPVSTHLPFDLIAVDEIGRLLKLQVKYRTPEFGKVIVKANSCSINSRTGKVKTSLLPLDWVDGWAVFCSKDSLICYLRKDELIGKGFTIRIKVRDSRSSQVSKMRLADSLRNPNRLF